MIIGITGGTGCGKTTALEVLSRAGVTVIDCDALYHRLLQTDQQLLAAIDSRFPGVVKENILDRKALGGIVFADAQALADLNTITHSAVCNAVNAQIAAVTGDVAIDAIGLLESDLKALCDITVGILAPENDRVQRIMARDGITEAYARMRIAAQKPDSYFREKCDYILENCGTKADFYAQCLAFFQDMGIMKTVN